MKRLMVIIVALALPVFLHAQVTPLAKFFEKYSGKPGFSSAEIKNAMINFDSVKVAEFARIQEALSDVREIRMLRYDGSNPETTGKIFKDKLNKALVKGKYEELASVNIENKFARLLVYKDKQQQPGEFAIVARGEGETVILTMTGKIDLSKIFNAQTMAWLGSILEKKGECMMKAKHCMDKE
jgi:hypothetical protein